MVARFHNDSSLESFKHDAYEAGYDVEHADQGTRDVTIDTEDDDEVARALVYLSGGDGLDTPNRPGPLINRRDGRDKTW